MEKLQSKDVINQGFLGHIFKYNKCRYFYNTLSSKIIRLNPLMEDLIGALLNKTKDLRLKRLHEVAMRRSEDEIIEALNVVGQKRDMFRTRREKLNVRLKNQYCPNKPNLFQLVIEITQNCNMRCKYCIYGDSYIHERKHSSLSISKDVAFKAIKYVLENPGNPKPQISFFGGEPLLETSLIENCIKYAISINPKTKFSITTNGILLNSANFDIIRKYNVKVGVSFDGSKETHDAYRVLLGDKGSFEIIKRNIEDLYKIDREYLAKNFTLLITLTDSNNLKSIQDFFKHNLLFNELSVTIHKIRRSGIKEHGIKFNNQPPKDSYLRALIDKYIKNFNKVSLKSMSVEHSYLSPLWTLIHKRRPVGNTISFDSLCVLGDWRLFVDVNGNFRICEKTDRLPIVGNVKSGIDWGLVDGMKKDFLSVCKPCLNCWAIGLCNVCWVDIYNSFNIVDQNVKNKTCKTKLKEYEIGLKVFTGLTEYYGDFLSQLD